jgi:hypothetical protein
MMVKSGCDLSLVRERRRARENSRARGKGVGCSGVELNYYSGRWSIGEVATGYVKALTSLMAGGGYEGVKPGESMQGS